MRLLYACTCTRSRPAFGIKRSVVSKLGDDVLFDWLVSMSLTPYFSINSRPHCRMGGSMSLHSQIASRLNINSGFSIELSLFSSHLSQEPRALGHMPHHKYIQEHPPIFQLRFDNFSTPETLTSSTRTFHGQKLRYSGCCLEP